MLPKMDYDPSVHPNPGVLLPLGGFVATKDFTPAQVELLVVAVGMYVQSMNRRIVAEPDVEARVVWQKKVDAANVLLSKVRTV